MPKSLLPQDAEVVKDARVYLSSMCYENLDPGLSNFRDNDY